MMAESDSADSRVIRVYDLPRRLGTMTLPRSLNIRIDYAGERSEPKAVALDSVIIPEILKAFNED